MQEEDEGREAHFPQAAQVDLPPLRQGLLSGTAEIQGWKTAGWIK
jgi:hypothetical protein